MGCNSSQPIDSFDAMSNVQKSLPVQEVMVSEKNIETKEKTTDLN